MTHSSKAIVISKESFGEADQYIQFLTREWGMITVLAKAARKSKRRYVGGLDLFCHNEIFIRGNPKEHPYLNELTVLNSFFKIRSNLDKLATAGKVLHWTKKLGDTGQDSVGVGLYSLVGQSLALIERESNPDRLELLSLLFRIKLLGEIGLRPKADACLNCESPESGRWQFDFGAGGVLCENCLSRLHPSHHSGITSEERLFLAHSEEYRFTQWPEIQLPIAATHSLQKMVLMFANYHTHLALVL